MQKGQMRANAACSSMSDISCLPVSTSGARYFFRQLLQVTDFCTPDLSAARNIADPEGIIKGKQFSA